MIVKMIPRYFLLLIFLLSACQASFDGGDGEILSTATPLPVSAATQTPVATISVFERLAEPTLSSVPSQADHGAQVYWLWCLPCHGDRGQGLTEEFRETYPPEDQNCWKSGCHGELPYEDGFTIPKEIPALIGSDVNLGKFANAAVLQSYILEEMPFWDAGALTEEESWKVVAFLLRENGIYYDQVLDDTNADQVLLFGTSPTLSSDRSMDYGLWIIGIILLIVVVFLLKQILEKPRF